MNAGSKKGKIVARLEEAEAPCFKKNASGSSSQMLPSSLSAFFFKVLPFP